jgi:hypothetical protein
VRDWQLLLRIYESDYLYLSEFGKCIQQVHGFDLPSMKKQMQTMSRQINEGVNKVSDLKRQIKEQESKFIEECTKFEVMPTLDSEALERQIYNLAKHVVPHFISIEASIRSKDTGLLQVIEYYKEFNKLRNYRNDVSLLMLSYFAKYGDENIKAYEFRKRQPQKALPKDI